jgi:hypothetical protein
MVVLSARLTVDWVPPVPEANGSVGLCAVERAEWSDWPRSRENG